MVLPERRLSDSQRAQRRAELMDAIATGGGRRPWVAPLAAAAVVAVVGGAAYGVTALGGSGQTDPRPLGGGSASAPDSSASETDSAPPTSSAPETCESKRPKNRADQMGAYRDQLADVQVYRDVLAEHLDPAGEHLDEKTSNVQSSGSGCGLVALGTKVGWSTAGQEGLGMVQVEVSTGDDLSQVRLSHGGWRPLRTDVEGVVSAEQVQYGEGFAVEVTRADGVTVAVDANLLFGNNSTEAVDAFPFVLADLVEVAADPALQVP